MDTSAETETSPESEKVVAHAWLFDVDGVITHPEQKKVTEPELFNEIIKRLKNGEPVALVTGRSLIWMIERIINPLKAKIKDKSVLANFFAVGEKGGTWITFSQNGEMEENMDQTISVPKFLQNEVRRLIETQFSKNVFYDETKQTMISTEMKDNISVSEYRVHQEKLNRLLEALLVKHGLTRQFKVDPTRIATDVENTHVGKALGARKVLDWLKEKRIKPEIFLAFGDSKSDVGMVQELYQRNLPVEFVFVGEREQLEGTHLPFSVTFTQAQCEKGTLEYLQRVP